MITNELLEEIWRIKDDLAREADYDIDKFCDQLRGDMQTIPPPVPLLRSPEEMSRFLDFGELPTASVHEEESPYGAKDS
jgi:hypothetical protein